MKISKSTIGYVQMLCDLLPKTLNEINVDYDKAEKEGHDYLFQSEARARFDRIRIEMNKTLIKIKKGIYR
jgi:hypothetical protein